MKAFVERMLAKVFATKAHDPDPDRMTGFERREAIGVNASPRGMRSRLAESNERARLDAADATAPRDVPMHDDFVDDSEAARTQAEAANVHDGSHLKSQPVDDSDEALQEIRDANKHEPPRSELADNTEEARYAAQRASERAEHKGEEEEEHREAQGR